ncbi:MAG: M50 family metallopeptidase [Anaerolineales bacterium]|jgi:regulator of sigma E protease
MSLTLIGGITFVLVFAGLILVHEFGHFIVAKMVGIEVEEFGIGIPPRIMTLFTWKGTKFTLNWLPLGGFNKMKGEEDPETKGGFMDSKPWKRITVLLAGSVMNLLVAVLAFTFYFSQVGIPNYKSVQILEIAPNSPAMQAGIQVNDIVISAGGQEITDTYQLSSIIKDNLDKPLTLTIKRGDATINLEVVPDSTRTVQEGATGMLLGSELVPAKTWFSTIPISLQATYQTGRELLSLPGKLIAGVVQPSEAELLGPRSIWNLFQASVQRDVESRQPASEAQGQAPTNYTLSGIISLALSLGLINLLPIPALDGGRIFFVLLEMIFRRRIPAHFESMIHGITFVILISVLGYFYIMDFIHPVSIILP